MFVQKIFSSNRTNIKILIIEDNVIDAVVIQDMLQDLGFIDIIIAKSGKEAIQLFSKKFDLIITDIDLPDINGIDMTKYYRNINPKKDTPIICCSSKADNLRKDGIDAGMDDFINKPVLPQKLLEILECWLPGKLLKQPHPDFIN